MEGDRIGLKIFDLVDDFIKMKEFRDNTVIRKCG